MNIAIFLPLFFLLATENLKKKSFFFNFAFWRYITSGKKKRLANSGHLKESKTKSMNLNPKKVGGGQRKAWNLEAEVPNIRP
jgi:hypothetical protein